MSIYVLLYQYKGLLQVVLHACFGGLILCSTLRDLYKSNICSSQIKVSYIVTQVYTHSYDSGSACKIKPSGCKYVILYPLYVHTESCRL